MGGTGGAGLPSGVLVLEGTRRSLPLPSRRRVGAGSSSSTSVSTANSPGVKADDTANDRLLVLFPRTERSRDVLPVILDILNVEYRFEDRLSSISVLFRAASEFAIARGGGSSGGVSGGDDAGPLRMSGVSGVDGSMMTGGGDMGLSTSE